MQGQRLELKHSARDARDRGSIAREEGASEASREWRIWAKAQQ